MGEQISNSDFDINILEGALTHPNIELTFPLPTDNDDVLDSKPNEKVSLSWKLLGNFLHFATGFNYNEVYSNAETKYSVHKMTKSFNKASEKYMLHKLREGDSNLDDIVYDLINSELRMNLIKGKDFPKRFKEVKDFMVKYYAKENKKSLPNFGSIHFLRVCYMTVIKTVSKMFPEGVWVNKKEFNMLYKQYLKDPMSIILLPNHQSHIDYVMLHLILIRFQMAIPMVIAGENLNVAVFGGILKGLGAIFIKRSFNDELYTEKNLYNYIEYVLVNKINLEVFIEGTRSRDGKLLLPKYGILKTLVSIYLKQRFKEKNHNFDSLIQPISIIYERVYESEGYLNELVGKDKKQESFMSILSNGVTNLVYGVDRDGPKRSEDGFIDNRNRTLHGKIFIKLADNFTLSSFIQDPENLIERKENDNSIADENVNLKKLGFKIMHAINGVSFLPQSSIVGTAIQTFYYLHGLETFSMNALLPMFDFIVQVYLEEQISETNLRMLTAITKLTNDEKAGLIKSQIIQFFKYTRVNPDTNEIRIENSFELLYYKNLGIHLIIHKCLASFILLRTSNLEQINKLFYIFTGFLKNEFLFDYDYNESNNLSSILQKFKETGIISNDYVVKDKKYLETLFVIIQPFINSFMVCVDNLNSTVGKFYAKSRNQITEQQLINDSLMSRDYPTTKTLLRIIQTEGLKKSVQERGNLYQIETYNKQYLLSFLFYLNNLRLIKIFKNKSRTKAYVIIINSRDLTFVLRFLQKLINENEIDDITLNYMIDIVDKTFDRDLEVPKAKL
ncbi:putative glycerol-3-phosphate acyltransferase [Clavispora lusitaniae]|uniref:Glycerol-3-phosphate acyltransferase n=1 Tax=Clavispora lusitaniae TaxID=36911 RepID=A0ACD0WDP1_CLALS|nr:putative glycerol-3-phosphate acyltransferase [Clavispora lusitaniae]QFZ31252.1 putative glycerol-3-phosphate acyltransferase [Clavispora lusitaniae]QFZ36920.1 putative glycerol-3-phosphate acyltransferase [Clavispora lusitaniae]QFZ42604.1 putative glycerol-3-phosphate acyltransferase [Clavispora lusitaniae]QFZ48280.1 putative glycerol-3-phosphate acyltransferase [Clavispora lusitaniae]